jgi:uncharacterized FAD-dependent dehydrogenase
MQTTISLQVKPSEAANEQILREYIARALCKPLHAITGFYRLKQSIDARNRKQVWVNCSLAVFVDEPFHTREPFTFAWQDVSQANKKVVVVGAGPAGLFAALKLIELGIQPIIIERGKDVRSRRRDLALLNKEGIVNPESNYCFGEGGAGTYSDGKLYTRSSKRGDITRILQLFYQFGAEENILYEAHPHIGTNKLPQIIVAMREHILNAGGRFLFEKKLTDFIIKNDHVTAVITADGETITGDAVILATGHSARDIFQLLYQKNILIEAKPFALGIRVEHPQSVIDEMQYHTLQRDGHLPPASYSIVEQVNQRGVFSFCMCPGGIIAPAATGPGELVVNGWSPSKRNNPFANSGMVVQVTEADAHHFLKKSATDIHHPLNLLNFQQSVEQTAFIAGGNNLQAPAQRMVDFCTNKFSTTLPACSYLPGVQSAELISILPDFIAQSLQKGLLAISKKMKGYYSNEAILVATESRTSSPVRIPRNTTTLAHPQINNLYPCGEGAGYAGGIVSAAMDGERVAGMIALKLA